MSGKIKQKVLKCASRTGWCLGFLSSTSFAGGQSAGPHLHCLALSCSTWFMKATVIAHLCATKKKTKIVHFDHFHHFFIFATLGKAFIQNWWRVCADSLASLFGVSAGKKQMACFVQFKGTELSGGILDPALISQSLCVD